MEYDHIGHGVGRVDGWEKVTGEAKFLRDFSIAGMLYGKILRSPYPHARIVCIDTKKARALPGVKAVITADETPKIKFGFVPQLADKLPLAIDKVRYIGDEIAAIAALDEEIAEEALSLIDVEYEELPAVFEVEEAIRPDAPKIHGNETNIAFKIFRRFGDVEEGFAKSDDIFVDRYSTHRVTHCCLETRGCIAFFAKSGKITVWSTTQTPYGMRNELSRILGIPPSQIRIRKTHVGGGFGSRLVMDMNEPIATLLSKYTGRPVAIFNTREDEFHYSANRYPFMVELKTGVKKDGTLVARKATVLVDNGAYNERGTSTLANAASSFIYLYRTRHIYFEGSLVYTNNLHGSAFRGFGNPQITFAMECQMDRISEKLGIDPAEIRLKNIFNSGEETASGAVIRGSGLYESIKRAVRESGWSVRRGERTSENIGTGMAITIHTGGGVRSYKYNAADAFINVHEDGKATVLVGVSEQGQGATTVLTQIVAEETGIPLSDITISQTDTDINPVDSGCFGSRSTYVLGNAVRSGAIDVKKQMLATSAEVLKANSSDLEMKFGSIYVKGSVAPSLSAKDAIQAHYGKGRPLSGRGRFVDEIPELDAVSGYGSFFPAYSYSCTIATVQVNPDNGNVDVLELVSANDLGKILNPLGAEGQVEGSLLQGLGYAFFEEVRMRNGQITNGSFLDYNLPTALELCPIKVVLLECSEDSGPYGAKGIGESPLVSVAPAIANAIYDAIGVRLNDLPFKKENILSLQKKKGQKPKG